MRARWVVLVFVPACFGITNTHDAGRFVVDVQPSAAGLEITSCRIESRVTTVIDLFPLNPDVHRSSTVERAACKRTATRLPAGIFPPEPADMAIAPWCLRPVARWRDARRDTGIAAQRLLRAQCAARNAELEKLADRTTTFKDRKVFFDQMADCAGIALPNAAPSERELAAWNAIQPGCKHFTGVRP